MTTARQPEHSDRIAAGQAELWADAELVRHYGSNHPEEWAGMEWSNDAPVRIVAAFSGRVEHHDHELRRLVSHPDRLTVASRRHSQRELQRIRRELRESSRDWHSDPLVRLTQRSEYVEIVLEATAAEMAAALLDRYGDAVRIQVGNLPFPIAKEAIRRPVLPAAAGPVSGLAVELVLDEMSTPSGFVASGSLVLRHSGAGKPVPYSVDEPQLGVTVRPGTREVLGTYVGALARRPRRLFLKPGDVVAVAAVVGTASVVAEEGYLLRPGTYGAVALVKLRGQGDTRDGLLLSPETTLVLT